MWPENPACIVAFALTAALESYCTVGIELVQGRACLLKRDSLIKVVESVIRHRGEQIADHSRFPTELIVQQVDMLMPKSNFVIDDCISVLAALGLHQVDSLPKVYIDQAVAFKKNPHRWMNPKPVSTVFTEEQSVLVPVSTEMQRVPVSTEKHLGPVPTEKQLVLTAYRNMTHDELVETLWKTHVVLSKTKRRVKNCRDKLRRSLVKNYKLKQQNRQLVSQKEYFKHEVTRS